MRRGLILAVAAGVVVVGNLAFHYLCDDAYIAFRYARNAAEGLGFVFNPPPFAPVEGYTSFAWVALLALIHSLTGIDAEASAPILSLGCALATVGVLHLLIRDTAALAVVLLGTVTNRSWLHWTTSGLETPLWTLALLSWVTLAVRQRFAPLLVLAALLPLIRPDGYLIAALTPGLFLLARRRPTTVELAAASAYALPMLHLFWRYQTYGFWLPNTYYAKVIASWPFMGAVYVGSFAGEYALPPLLLLGAWAAWRKGVPPILAGVGIILAAQTLAHLRWGGDHFEYRILVHWIPLVWWLGVQALTFHRFVFPGLIVTWLLGLFVPWAHFVTHDQLHYSRTHDVLDLPLSPRLPAVVWPWIYPWERAQQKMNYHLVAMRHHHLRRFIEGQREWYRNRTDLPEGPGHIIAVGNPGWPGWVMPDVAIVDTLGLTDAVVAHAPPPPPESKRRIAHERKPPGGYVACFRPDLELSIVGGHIGVRSLRQAPADASTIRACEQKWWAEVGIGTRLPSP